MQYTTDYVVSVMHRQTELEFERELERRRFARERSDERRAAARVAGVAAIRGPLLNRMPFAGLLSRFQQPRHELSRR